jgi:hypothetical protein
MNVLAKADVGCDDDASTDNRSLANCNPGGQLGARMNE